MEERLRRTKRTKWKRRRKKEKKKEEEEGEGEKKKTRFFEVAPPATKIARQFVLRPR